MSALLRALALVPLLFAVPREDPPPETRPIPFDGGLTCVLQVKDVNAAIGWYYDALGFEVRHRMPEFGFAEIATSAGDTRIGLLLRDPPRVGAGAVLAFGVRDVKEAERRLRARNVRITSAISEVPYFTKHLVFTDPDGNVLQIYESLFRPNDAPSDLPSLAFLTGSWRRVEGWTMSELHWTAGGGSTMLGMSRTVENGRTTAFEFARIERDDDGMVFVLSLGGGAALSFPLKEVVGARAVFESKEQGFPQRITYWIDADGMLRALFEGTVEGAAKREERAWRRSGIAR